MTPRRALVLLAVCLGSVLFGGMLVVLFLKWILSV